MTRSQVLADLAMVSRVYRMAFSERALHAKSAGEEWLYRRTAEQAGRLADEYAELAVFHYAVGEGVAP